MLLRSSSTITDDSSFTTIHSNNRVSTITTSIITSGVTSYTTISARVNSTDNTINNTDVTVLLPRLTHFDVLVQGEGHCT